jgi:hypothetical protein
MYLGQLGLCAQQENSAPTVPLTVNGTMVNTYIAYCIFLIDQNQPFKTAIIAIPRCSAEKAIIQTTL